MIPDILVQNASAICDVLINAGAPDISSELLIQYASQNQQILDALLALIPLL